MPLTSQAQIFAAGLWLEKGKKGSATHSPWRWYSTLSIGSGRKFVHLLKSTDLALLRAQKEYPNLTNPEAVQPTNHPPGQLQSCCDYLELCSHVMGSLSEWVATVA